VEDSPIASNAKPKGQCANGTKQCPRVMVNCLQKYLNNYGMKNMNAVKTVLESVTAPKARLK
jgi:hypothetical protein